MEHAEQTAFGRRLVLCAFAVVGLIVLLDYPTAGAAQQPAQAAASMSIEAVIEDLVAANRILAKEGILDGYGHVSVRHPTRAMRFLMSRSVAPALVDAADVMEFGLDGEPVDARGRASYLERFIHSEIYRVRPEVNAVVHCHTPSLIPFADSDVPLRAMYHQSAFIAEGVPVFDMRSVAGMTDLLVKTPMLGTELANVLGGRPAVLMRGHGAAIVGLTIPHVVGRSVEMNINARAQVQAITLGGRITYIDPEEAKQRLSPRIYDRAWELWKMSVMK